MDNKKSCKQWSTFFFFEKMSHKKIIQKYFHIQTKVFCVFKNIMIFSMKDSKYLN